MYRYITPIILAIALYGPATSAATWTYELTAKDATNVEVIGRFTYTDESATDRYTHWGFSSTQWSPSF